MTRPYKPELKVDNKPLVSKNSGWITFDKEGKLVVDVTTESGLQLAKGLKDHPQNADNKFKQYGESDVVEAKEFIKSVRQLPWNRRTSASEMAEDIVKQSLPPSL